MSRATSSISNSKSSTPAALLIGQLHHIISIWEKYGRKYDTIQFQGTRDQFLSKCKNGHFDKVVALYRTSSTTDTGAIDKEFIDILPASLEFVCLNAAGYDGVDIDACTARGIRISNTPGIVDDATADVAIFLLLGALRQAYIPIISIRAGQWKGTTPLGRDPEGKCLGILGMGGIGRAFARRARAFGMKIIYHNRSRLEPGLEGDAEYVSFEDLLRRSDILSLHLSLTSQTRHIISKPQFQLMKDGAVMINTARGALINEQDLVEALDSGKIYSAGLDVFEDEPNVHPRLLQNERVMIVPHIGTTTLETKTKMEELALSNLENAIDFGQLLTPIPEHS